MKYALLQTVNALACIRNITLKNVTVYKRVWNLLELVWSVEFHWIKYGLLRADTMNTQPSRLTPYDLSFVTFQDQKKTCFSLHDRCIPYDVVWTEGLSFPASVHRDAGTAGRNVGGLLANVVGAQLQHRRHAHQTTRSRPSKYSSTLHSFIISIPYLVTARSVQTCLIELSVDVEIYLELVHLLIYLFAFCYDCDKLL